MPCGVTANRIEVLADGSVRVSGTFIEDQPFRVSVTDLTVSKAATLNAPNWSVVFSGTEITGNLAEFRRNHCDGTAKYAVSRPFYGPVEAQPCGGTADVSVQCEIQVECPDVTVTVQPGECNADNTRRMMTFRVSVGGGAQIRYQWNFGDGSALTPEATGSGNFEDPPHPYPAGDTYFANLFIIDPPGCTQPDPITVNVDTCDGPRACPDVTVTVRPGECNADNTRRTMAFEVSVGGGESIRYRWNFGDGSPLSQVATGSDVFQVRHPYPAGDTYFANLIITEPAECTATPDPIRVIVEACEEEEEDCPVDSVTLAVESNGLPVTKLLEKEGCLPRGLYVVRAIIDPPGATNSFRWRVDEAPAVVGQLGVVSITGNQLILDLTASRSVSVIAAGCADATVKLPLCKCPDTDLGIEVTTEDGTPVDTSQCVAPGMYHFTAVGDVGDADLQWTADGQDLGNVTEATFNFDPPSTTGCCGAAPPSSTISLTAKSSDPECPDATSSVTLTLCRTNRFCVDCWLLRLLIVFFAILAAIGLAVWLCAEVVVSPLVPATAALVPIALVVAPWVMIIAGAIALLLLLFWWWWCQPDWCNDWVVLIWQLLLGVGFVFVYFGLCPACSVTLLPIGVPLFGGGIAVFVLWIIFCRPSPCKIFFEIGSLGLVQVVVSWLEFVIGGCIWQWGWLIHLLWDLILLLVGWIGAVIACNVNPND